MNTAIELDKFLTELEKSLGIWTDEQEKALKEEVQKTMDTMLTEGKPRHEIIGQMVFNAYRLGVRHGVDVARLIAMRNEVADV